MAREIESPVIILPTEQGELRCHYLNSRLRTFSNADLDHIEYRGEDGQLVGLRVGRAVLDAFFEQQFPMSFDPVIDEATEDWFVRSEMRILDNELDNL